MFAKSHANLTGSPAGEHTVRPAELDDRTLWLRFKTGNDLAFSILYKKYVQRLYNYGMHSCQDRDLVKDCLQELFARLWDKRAQLADVEAVNFYLFKSYRRLLINKLVEKRKKSFLNSSEEGFELMTSYEDSIILEEASTEQIEHLRRAVASLTKRQREVIFLKFYNDLSYQEVAAIMEMGADSVYNLMSKAIDALRTSIKASYAVFCLFLADFLIL